jgi:hypothetical protein
VSEARVSVAARNCVGEIERPLLRRRLSAPNMRRHRGAGRSHAGGNLELRVGDADGKTEPPGLQDMDGAGQAGGLLLVSQFTSLPVDEGEPAWLPRPPPGQSRAAGCLITWWPRPGGPIM